MTDSELLDRRVEQLVVSTVHRELTRLERQRAGQAAQFTTEALTEEERAALIEHSAGNANLTTSVLMVELRIVRDRLSQSTMANDALRSEVAMRRAEIEAMTKKLGQQKSQLEAYNANCIRLVQERDLARQDVLVERKFVGEARREREHWHNAYNELAKATA